MNKNITEDKSMELAEESRQKEWSHPSFVAEIFKGNFKWNLIHPYPQQPEEDKIKGDKFLAKIEEILKLHLNPDEVDETGKIPEKAIEELIKIGAYGMKIPEKYGGLGLSNINYTRAISLVSSYCASTAVQLSAHQSIGVPQPLKIFGTEEQKKKYFPRIAGGELSAFALTEPDVGSDPARMSTKAELSEDGTYYTLNGVKQWCTNGPDADLIIVMALTKPKVVKGKERQQISAFILETNTPGVEVKHRCSFMGLGGISNGTLSFENVKIPAENIVGKEGEGLKIAFVTLNAGRLAIPVCSAAAGKKCMSIVKDWSNKRIQWGKTIGEHQSVANFLGNISADTFAMESMSRLAIFMADLKNVDIRLEAAIAKYFCSEVACKIVDDTLQVKGGRGYEKSTSLEKRGEKPDPIERMARDLRINRIIEGSSEIMQLFIAREAVDSHFKLAMPFLKAKNIGTKLSSGLKMMFHYACWFPKLFIPRFGIFKTKYLNYRNRCHLRYIKITSRKLARNLFLSMAKHKIKLQDEQVLLSNYVDIGVKLFAMASSLAYAEQLIKEKGDDKSIQNLACAYCSKARKEIKRHFEDICNNKYEKKFKLNVSKDLLNNKFDWLEKENIM